MPHPHTSSPGVPPAPADTPTLPPALQRRMRHLDGVRTLRTRAAIAAAAVLSAALVGFAVPSLADGQAPFMALEAPEVVAPAQTLTVASAAPLTGTQRDSYEAVLRPQLQYPVPYGSAVASGYGPRECANCHSNFHHGIDIFPGAGTPIVAMASGVVSKAHHTTRDSMGVTVVIDHVIDGQKVTSLYGHLQEGSLSLQVGDVVTVGDVIGLVGATGNANGAHLHFEIHPGGSGSVNPYEWLGARI